MNIQKSISLNDKTWEKIDKLRVSLPRSKFVGRIIEEELRALENEEMEDR